MWAEYSYVDVGSITPAFRPGIILTRTGQEWEVSTVPDEVSPAFLTNIFFVVGEDI